MMKVISKVGGLSFEKLYPTQEPLAVFRAPQLTLEHIQEDIATLIDVPPRLTKDVRMSQGLLAPEAQVSPRTKDQTTLSSTPVKSVNLQ